MPTPTPTATSTPATDSDNDGLSDNDEILVWSTNPNDVDSDGDGVTDGTEALLEATNPANPFSYRRLVPRMINYQARLHDGTGNPVNEEVNISFGLFDTSTGGSALWTEEHLLDVSDGICNVLLGGVNEIPRSVFGTKDIYLEITIEGETLFPRRQVFAQALSMNAMLVAGKRLEVGVKTFSVANTNVMPVPVIFPRIFTIPPKIALSAQDMRVGGELFVVQKITDISTTGFTVVIETVNGATASGESNFAWIAHGD